MLSKYESNILINGFLANFQISIAKWSMHRHVADNGLTQIYVIVNGGSDSFDSTVNPLSAKKFFDSNFCENCNKCSF